MAGGIRRSRCRDRSRALRTTWRHGGGAIALAIAACLAQRAWPGPAAAATLRLLPPPAPSTRRPVGPHGVFLEDQPVAGEVPGYHDCPSSLGLDASYALLGEPSRVGVPIVPRAARPNGARSTGIVAGRLGQGAEAAKCVSIPRALMRTLSPSTMGSPTGGIADDAPTRPDVLTRDAACAAADRAARVHSIGDEQPEGAAADVAQIRDLIDQALAAGPKAVEAGDFTTVGWTRVEKPLVSAQRLLQLPGFVMVGHAARRLARRLEAACEYADAASLATRRIVVGGQLRSFHYVGLPHSKSLVIVLHGGGGSGPKIREQTERRWDDAALTNSFTVVYPDGTPWPDAPGQHSWNDCRSTSQVPGDGGLHPTDSDVSSEDDTGFLLAMIDWFVAERGIDSGRVFLVGASNGGMMTQRLAREAGERFAGFAPSISNLTVADECSAPEPSMLRKGRRPMIFLYSTADEWMPPAGGCIAPLPYPACEQGVARSAAETIAQWKAWLGVTASAPEKAMPDPDTSDHSRQYWQDHYRGGRLVLRVVRVEGAGHSLPGDTQLSDVQRVLLRLGWKNLDRNHVRTTARFFGLCKRNPQCW